MEQANARGRNITDKAREIRRATIRANRGAREETVSLPVPPFMAFGILMPAEQLPHGLGNLRVVGRVHAASLRNVLVDQGFHLRGKKAVVHRLVRHVVNAARDQVLDHARFRRAGENDNCRAILEIEEVPGQGVAVLIRHAQVGYDDVVVAAKRHRLGIGSVRRHVARESFTRQRTRRKTSHTTFVVGHQRSILKIHHGLRSLFNSSCWFSRLPARPGMARPGPGLPARCTTRRRDRKAFRPGAGSRC